MYIIFATNLKMFFRTISKRNAVCSYKFAETAVDEELIPNENYLNIGFTTCTPLRCKNFLRTVSNRSTRISSKYENIMKTNGKVNDDQSNKC